MSLLTDEQLLDEVKKRKLIHPDIIDGWQKARRITQLQEEIKTRQQELSTLTESELPEKKTDGLP